MNRPRRYLAAAALLGMLCLSGLPLITACNGDAGYGARPEIEVLVDELVAEGLDAARVRPVLASATRQDSVLEAISRPAEKTRPWYEYRKIFLTVQRTEAGQEFLARHAEVFSRAERELGVPREIIAAIIGVETAYGRVMGSYRVLDALSTLALDYPPRAPFFRSELKHFMHLTAEQGLDAEALLGSYAGAMGLGQFMPSSYRRYAIDFDGDDVADIWTSPADAIGSVANYLAEHGWRPGEPIVASARAPETVSSTLRDAGLEPKLTVAALRREGLEALEPLAPEALATPIVLEQEEGDRWWLGLENFYVITRYNHSAMYAMSVVQLSERLRTAAAP